MQFVWYVTTLITLLSSVLTSAAGDRVNHIEYNQILIRNNSVELNNCQYAVDNRSSISALSS